MATPDYAKLVTQAEAAAASVKDPELKRVAFQKILEDSLSGGTALEPKTGGVGVRAAPGAAAVVSARRASGRSGPQAYVDELVGEGYFKRPKTIAQVKAELENRGHHIALTSLSGPLQKLCQRRQLRRQRTASSAGKQTYAYSNW